MKLILDTHTFIWFINGDENLSRRAKKEILNKSNIKFVSIASMWEIAIKISLKRLAINMPFKEVFNQVNENGFEILPITFEHTELLSRLEFHHRDPFDRLIAAQAGCERMAVISKDRAFDHYRVERVW